MNSMEWRAKNPDKYRAYQREYQRKLRAKNPDYYRLIPGNERGSGEGRSDALREYQANYQRAYRENPYVRIKSSNGLWLLDEAHFTRDFSAALAVRRREANRLLKLLRSKYPQLAWERVDACPAE